MTERSSGASALAGFVGSLSTIALFPLETLKIHMMVSDGFSKNYIPKYNNAFHALRNIYTQKGALGLYKGCHLTLFSSLA